MVCGMKVFLVPPRLYVVDMSALGQLVRKLREERGWTLDELAQRINVSGSALARKERGEIRIKPPERKDLAKVFGMSLEDFDQQWRAGRMERTVGGPGIPVINRAPAGQVIDYEEYGVDSGQGMEYLDWGDIRDDLAFAVVVVGDSMEPSLSGGDYLILSSMSLPKPRARLEDGSVVFVRFTPESGRRGCTIARWHPQPDGSIILSKDNSRHKPIVCQREDIEQLAVAVEKRSKRI